MFSVDLNRSLNLVSIRDSFGYKPKDLQDKIVKWNVKFLHFSLDHYRPVGRFPFING